MDMGCLAVEARIPGLLGLKLMLKRPRRCLSPQTAPYEARKSGRMAKDVAIEQRKELALPKHGASRGPQTSGQLAGLQNDERSDVPE
jgi:hypothetical protein